MTYHNQTTEALTLYHGMFFLFTSYSFATAPPFGRLRGAPRPLGPGARRVLGAPLAPCCARHGCAFGGLRKAIASSMGGIAAINVSHRAVSRRAVSPRILSDSLRSAPHHRKSGVGEAPPPLVFKNALTGPVAKKMGPPFIFLLRDGLCNCKEAPSGLLLNFISPPGRALF